MSASMHPSVAAAAVRLAQQALPMTPAQQELAELREQAAREGVPYRRLCADWVSARVDARAKQQQPDRPSPAAQTWGRIPPRVRMLLALAAVPDVDPEAIALSSWGALSAEQRRGLGVVARELRRTLLDAAALV